jgi:hypothetical protein
MDIFEVQQKTRRENPKRDKLPLARSMSKSLGTGETATVLLFDVLVVASMVVELCQQLLPELCLCKGLLFVDRFRVEQPRHEGSATLGAD